MKCVGENDLVRLVAGQLPPDEAAFLERHLSDCRSCSKRRDNLVSTTRRLAPDPGEFDQPALVENVMTLLRLGQPTPRGVTGRKILWWNWVLLPAAAGLAVLVVILVWPFGSQLDVSGFRARGGFVEKWDRWVSLRVFKATEAGYQPVGETISRDEALAFGYDNRSSGNYRFLMVFAVDEKGSVYWYYPGFRREGENPRSVAIRNTAGPTDLPDEIRHSLSPGKLRIVALFSAQPLEVSSVEAKIAEDLARVGSVELLERLSFEETGQQSFLIQVRPQIESLR